MEVTWVETEHVRDLNASINIRDKGLKILAAAMPGGMNAHGQQVRLAKARHG